MSEWIDIFPTDWLAVLLHHLDMVQADYDESVIDRAEWRYWTDHIVNALHTFGE